ncbi:MAG: hypothetical protein EPO26_04950 [Chloroflexota bacterium]|nr:MAG: hypothetical protein EPO26_04950 [Chloroflexota bacterium]
MSTALPRTPYHIADQNADALLRPVGAALDDLVARLTQYHDRLHMAEADRARIGQARDIVSQARAACAALEAPR